MRKRKNKNKKRVKKQVRFWYIFPFLPPSGRAPSGTTRGDLGASVGRRAGPGGRGPPSAALGVRDDEREVLLVFWIKEVEVEIFEG